MKSLRFIGNWVYFNSPHARESRIFFLVRFGIRNIFTCGWSGILGFGIRNTGQGIRNPTSDWNPESSASEIQNPRLSWIPALLSVFTWRHGWIGSCPKPDLCELNSFLMQTISFVPINLHRCWPREWKHSIWAGAQLLIENHYWIFIVYEQKKFPTTLQFKAFWCASREKRTYFGRGWWRVEPRKE